MNATKHHDGWELRESGPARADHAIGRANDERRALEECPHVALVTIPDTGHFTLNQEPGRIAELIVPPGVASASPDSRSLRCERRA